MNREDWRHFLNTPIWNYNAYGCFHYLYTVAINQLFLWIFLHFYTLHTEPIRNRPLRLFRSLYIGIERAASTAYRFASY